MITEITDIDFLPQDLLKRAQKGDHESLKKIYNRYDKPMYSVCLRMLNNKAEAQDALQESFITAFRKINGYEGKGSFRSWLKKIVINKCLDALRKRKVAFVELYDTADEQIQEEEEHIDYTVDEIRHAVSLLPDGYRVVLNLFLFEDHSHKMIAEKLGISEGTSKSQYARARVKLQSLIKSERISNGR